MGRLIDADALIAYMEEKADETKQLDNIIVAVVCGAVYEQPTAYDVEKVVAELEQQVNQYNRRARELVDKDTEAGIHNKGKACSYEHAIDIVKRGGVE